MIKYILSLLIISSSLLNAYTLEREVIIHENSNLDFSDINGRLETLKIISGIDCRPFGDLYTGKSKLGLDKNTNLKEIIVVGQGAQTAVALSYLPGVETYSILHLHPQTFHNLDYLPHSLPYLKYFQLNLGGRENLLRVLEDVGKLEYLECLVIFSDNYHWGRRWGEYIFTDQELEALSKLHQLKRLIISVWDTGNYEEKPKFDPDQRQILEDLLPNTMINLIIEKP